jgi:hypothetical protein
MVQFKGRSLYNFLKISLKENPSLQAESWQVFDYRKLSLEELFERLKQLKISLTTESFCLYAGECDTPEELLECLWLDENDEIGEEKAYLILFELWRRLLPEKQSLSIFCDELDELISLYDAGLLEEEEALQKAFSELEDILDESIDHGALPGEIFQSVASYLAHDVESFLYDYILDLLEEGNEVYASELIDAMSVYVADRKWFDFLKVRLFALSDEREASILASRLLEMVEEDPDFTFLLEVAEFLVHRGDVSLFSQCIKQMIPLIRVEQDLVETLKLIADFYHCLDREEPAEVVETCMQKRKGKEMQLPVAEEDLKCIEKFLAFV